uniref:Cas1_AcylT domain-containing protein n=1 Tax=Caenorhabditis tropicalis TaxID=1561998 RepID=A0A1I7UGJ9_9PELO
MIILYFSRFLFKEISRKRSLFIVSQSFLITRYDSLQGCVTIFHYIYLFNPWIAKYQKRAEDFYTTFPYTIKLHSIVFYCCLVIAAFICWLPWQNQSKKKELNNLK